MDLPIRGSAKVAFSPDQRWLVTGDTVSYQFWRTGTWVHDQENIPSAMGEHYGTMAFSSRKTALAIACRRTEFKILHPITLEVRSSPDFDHEAPLCFDPSGSIMVTYGPTGGLFFWKTDTIRAHLLGLGLDWEDLPQFAPISYPVVRRVVVPAAENEGKAPMPGR